LKLFFHFDSYTVSNSYILGTEKAPKEAIIIDPGVMDVSILNTIEENEYTLRAVLVTHGHTSHIHGIKTLRRIYNTDIYCISPVILEHKTTPVKDGVTFIIGSFNIEVIAVPGHSTDSAVFKIDRMLFTGDAISAGLTGRTSSIYAAANQINALRGKILSMPGDYSIFPGHGPPTSLEAERRFNTSIITYKDYGSQRPSHRFEHEFD
jgi:glyoxylase-like metal-dependent hydrolase (beta-lactamase superfamily II)